MGICGEETASKYSITRESQDAHCIESYKRAAKAWSSGAFKEEIAPVSVKGRKGVTVVEEDEEFKNAMFDKIPGLRPAFKKDGGTITAANSSKLNDGASAVILMSESKAKELGLTPLAKIICELSITYILT
jgi:acetyl-CoA C-acetyltransferase